MKKLMLGATAALVLLLVLPLLGTAVLLSASAAAADQAGSCTSVATPATGAWRPPLQQAYTLTSRFGPRTDPITGASKNHTGVDLAALPGPGPVVAAAAGTVTVGADPDGYGTYLTVEHGGGISTLLRAPGRPRPRDRHRHHRVDGSTARRGRQHRARHRHPPALRDPPRRHPHRPRRVHARARCTPGRHGQSPPRARPALLPVDPRPAARRRRVRPTRARHATAELGVQPAAADPRADQGLLPGRGRAVSAALDRAGRHRHGRERPRPQPAPPAAPGRRG